MNWLNTHKGAIIAFAGAQGLFIHSVSPGFAAATGTWAGDAFVIVGILGAVLQSYITGSQGE